MLHNSAAKLAEAAEDIDLTSYDSGYEHSLEHFLDVCELVRQCEEEWDMGATAVVENRIALELQWDDWAAPGAAVGAPQHGLSVVEVGVALVLEESKMPSVKVKRAEAA